MRATVTDRECLRPGFGSRVRRNDRRANAQVLNWLSGPQETRILCTRDNAPSVLQMK